MANLTVSLVDGVQLCEISHLETTARQTRTGGIEISTNIGNDVIGSCAEYARRLAAITEALSYSSFFCGDGMDVTSQREVTALLARLSQEIATLATMADEMRRPDDISEASHAS